MLESKIIYQDYLKRLIDIFLVLLSLPVILPLSLFVALCVRVNIGAPILFVQERPGLKAKPFKMIKFRTMTDARNSDGTLLSDEVRLTNFGKLLRKTSLDELPEFWNILKGEMSFVGPRPLLMRYLKLYSPEQMRRHEVRPGLTGLAQVNGRNSLNWDEKFDLDIEYVKNCSLKADLLILIKTLKVVIGTKGVTAENEPTMTEFTGSDNIQNK